MKRQQQFARVQQMLLKRRDALRRSLQGELTNFQTSDAGVGDAADAAVDGDYFEINSQLAQTESRELMRIEHAIECIRHGTYGTCEVCGGKIAAARLQALPYATMCIECQQSVERENRHPHSSRIWSEAPSSSSDEEDVANDPISIDRLDAVA